VNGDGYDDILIGAPMNDDGASGSGKAYLIFGKESGWAMDTKLSQADATFLGEHANVRAGFSVSGAGDVNGDGFDDLLIAADQDDDAGTNYGQTYLILGKSTGWTKGLNLSNADASFVGARPTGGDGMKVAGGGDVNGDGYDDILIGVGNDNEAYFDAGQTFLIFGKAAGWSMDVGLSNVNASFQGQAASDRVGSSIAGAGDVNGDGYDDILIGAVGANHLSLAGPGRASLILGKPSGWAMKTNVSTADESFVGSVSWDSVGASVSGNGDANGDGYDDILVGASRGDAATGFDSGLAYLIFPDGNSKPTSVNSVKVFIDSNYAKETKCGKMNSTIYVQLQGLDGNSSRRDTALVKITNNASLKNGISLRLLETGLNTGIYRGNFTIGNRSHENLRWIGATTGDNLTVASAQDPSKNVSLVVGPVLLYPLIDTTTALEDLAYTARYWVPHFPSCTWNFESNASWLKWDSTTHIISGTPNNSMVGNYHIKINVTDARVGSDEHNFILTVNNTPPEIETADIEKAVEGHQYYVDYNSSDDGQRMTTWYLDTDDGGWLSINSTTGVLSGIPANEDVGAHHVNVSVEDGNNGWNWSNFTLNVMNTNDKPSITSQDNTQAFEDTFYSVQYNAIDVDKGDSLYWYLSTNASGWLSIGLGTGLLTGMPTNDNVDNYWVNVTVKDIARASDFHNFTLIVNNTNDIPVITSVPIDKAIALVNYEYDVNAVDIDTGDVLTYSLDTKPENMTIDSATGLIGWIPNRQQIGSHQVIVNVSDSTSSVTQSFSISVSNLPLVTLLSPPDASEISFTNPVLSWSVDNPNQGMVLFNVYLSKVKTDVEAGSKSTLIAKNLIETSWLNSGLDKGSIYYWTVIPNDGLNEGKCKNDVWSFKVVATANINKYPIITSVPITSAIVGKDYRYDVDAHDDDAGDVLTYSLSQKPDGMAIDSHTGRISWIPSEAQVGNQSVTVQVSDGKVSVSQTYKITVTKEVIIPNNKPAITKLLNKTINVGDKFVLQVTASDSDVGDTLSYRLDSPPDGMTISVTGQIQWVPNEDQTGDHEITVNVSDGKSYTLATFILTVKKNGGGPSTGLSNLIIGAIVGIIIAAVVVLVALLLWRRKGKAEPVNPGLASHQPVLPAPPPS
jgi:hypothetical protein